VLFQNDLWARVDALLPVGAICIPDFTSRLPAASTSLMGHGPAGARVAERKR
jgi:hypothetical protein